MEKDLHFVQEVIFSTLSQQIHKGFVSLVFESIGIITFFFFCIF